jgi:hypothetical protein
VRDKGVAISNEGMKSCTPAETKCFRCLGQGHHQYECENEPVQMQEERAHGCGLQYDG